jgi:hypothetical protein
MKKQKRPLKFADLDGDAKALIREILGHIITGHVHQDIIGLTEEEKIDGVIRLIEAGYLRLCEEGDEHGGRYWLEPTLPETMPDL